jgi:hypothetical protein
MSPILIGAGSFLIRKLGQLTAGMHRSKLSIDYISYMILAGWGYRQDGSTDRVVRQTGWGYRQDGGTDRMGGQTVGVGLVAVRGGPSLSIGCGRSSFVSGAGGSSSSGVVRGWGIVIRASSRAVVVLGARSMVWFEGGGGGCSVVVALRCRVVVSWSWSHCGLSFVGGGSRSWALDWVATSTATWHVRWP